MPSLQWKITVEKVLEVNNLTKWFAKGKNPFTQKDAVRAVDGISFIIYQREVLGLVGESGCGKTTCGKLILRILEPSKGSIIFNDNDITSLSPTAPGSRLVSLAIAPTRS